MNISTYTVNKKAKNLYNRKGRTYTVPIARKVFIKTPAGTSHLVEMKTSHFNNAILKIDLHIFL